jgi:uncharacterized protein (TIGR03435 family)
MMSRLLRVTVGCVLATTFVFAQAKPSFEVATIKRSERLEAGGSFGMQPGGRFRSINVDARGLIACAYRTAGENCVFPSQVISAPDWVATERYDITAKVSDDLAGQSPTALFQQMALLLQSLLEERFKLRVHKEKRALPVYALRVLRKDAMRLSTATCPDDRDKCSLNFLTGRVRGGAMTMMSLVSVLAGNTGRVVIDDTGLQGRFDVTLEWSPDQSATEKPSIFTALQEQLGLKLEATRAPVDVVVIDHVERPSED